MMLAVPKDAIVRAQYYDGLLLPSDVGLAGTHATGLFIQNKGEAPIELPEYSWVLTDRYGKHSIMSEEDFQKTYTGLEM